MKKKRATHRRVRDAATPQVHLTGPYLQHQVEFTIHPIGKPDTIRFTLSWWQIRDLLSNLKILNESHAKQLEREAGLIRGTIQ